MNLFRRFKQKRQIPSTTQQAWGDFNGYLSYLMRWVKGDRFISKDSPTLINAYYGTVYSCIDKRSKGVAGTRWRLFTTKQSNSRSKTLTTKQKDYLFSLPSLTKNTKSATDIIEITDHPILDLFWDTNDIQNEYQLKIGTVAYQDIEGTCYWNIIKGPIKPIAIEFIPPQYMTPILEIINGKPTGKISHYIYKNGKDEIRYEIDEIVQFSYFNPITKLKGFSPTRAACESVSLDHGMVDFLFDALANRLRQEVILTSEGQLQKPIIESIQAQMEEYRTTKKDRMPVLPGNLKPITLSGNMRDLPFVQNRRYERELISNVFGVPISMFSTESSNRAVQEASEYEFSKYTVFPMCEQIQQQINQQLIPMYGDDSFFISFDNPIPANKEQELKETTELVKTNVMTINEARLKNKLDPFPEDYIWTAQGLIPISAIGMSPDEQGKQFAKAIKKELSNDTK